MTNPRGSNSALFGIARVRKCQRYVANVTVVDHYHDNGRHVPLDRLKTAWRKLISIWQLSVCTLFCFSLLYHPSMSYGPPHEVRRELLSPKLDRLFVYNLRFFAGLSYLFMN